MAEEQKPSLAVPELAREGPDAAVTPCVTREEGLSAEATTATADNKAAQSADEATAATTADNKSTEVKPLDEGFLAHKAQGASFPKNFITTKEFFFFGSDAIDPKSLSTYQKGEKSIDVAQANVAWASHTGKGLLFVGDKKAPTGVINLADANEPEVDGTNKFYFTSKGSKHTFKAATTAERDGWIAQLKVKIAEAKQLAATVVESETYKKTLDSFKPAPLAKDDKPAEEAVKADEPAKAEEAPKDGALKDEAKDEEPKSRSASRKRASFFGFGKKEEKKEEPKLEDVPVTDSAVEVDSAKADEPPTADTQLPAAEDKAVEEPQPAESPKEKPVFSKRNSIFSGVFSKKEKKATESLKPSEGASETAAANEAPAGESAPVIPPMASSAPLAVDVSESGADNTEATAAEAEPKKDIKEKRKSSLPFAFGKREKSPAPVDGEEKAGKSPFSKLRATIKGKTAMKTDDKPHEETVKEEATAAASSKPVAASEPSTAVADGQSENKPEGVTTTTPAVTAAA